MKALVCHKPNDISYVEVEKPTPQAGEILLKVAAVGICGTDIHAYLGKQPFFSYPRILGHEISGSIEAVGQGVKKQIGKKGIVIPAIACGACSACRVGKPNCCESISVMGVHQDGGFQEYITVPEKNILIVPDNLSFSACALIEPFAIAGHAVRRANVAATDKVLVVGAGAIGIGVATIVKSLGAEVIVAEVSKERREHIETRCQISTLNPLDEKFQDILKKAFDGVLPNILLDATGNKDSMSNSVHYISHAGRIVFIGLYQGNLELDDPTFHKKETTLLASRNANKEDFQQVIDMFQTGALQEKMMKNQEFSFSTFGNSYHKDVASNPCLVKGVVLFD